MSRIVIHPSDFNIHWAHYNMVTDSLFFKTLEEKGHEIVFSKNVELKVEDVILIMEAKNLVSKLFIFKSSTGIVAIKALVKALLEIFLKRHERKVSDKFKNNKKILLIFEGKIHAPENHNRDLVKYCDYILTWNDDLVNDRNFIKVYIPQQNEWDQIDQISFSDKKLLTIISSNAYSHKRNELYSERRRIIRYAEKNIKDEFNLYGFNWNKPATLWQKIFAKLIPHYISYHGQVESKATIFSKHRFAIVYENNRTQGYVTEKVFDCLRSNCVPIYLGAPNIGEILPANTFIDRSKFSTDGELVDFIQGMSEETYNEYLSSVEKFIGSDEFNKHLSSEIAERIHQVLIF